RLRCQRSVDPSWWLRAQPARRRLGPPRGKEPERQAWTDDDLEQHVAVSTELRRCISEPRRKLGHGCQWAAGPRNDAESRRHAADTDGRARQGELPTDNSHRVNGL